MRHLYLLFCFCAFSAFAQPQLVLEQVGTGFSTPVDIENAGDDRLFIVERDGIIRILNTDGTTVSTPFLNINPRVSNSGGERGLLGLAFHPDYANNGYFFVNYTDNSGKSVISRFSVNTFDPNTADATSEKIVLTQTQPYSNHNGGDLAFGPDGYLYIGLGDGGSGGDPENRSQNRQTFLGKMLRIDIDTDEPYAIPADNPFVDDDSTLDEIWAVGLRNPWRYSFDRETGDLWIGDVGQGELEEVDLQPADSPGGENYGWRCYEGTNPYTLTGCGDISQYTFPVHDYTHGSNGCSITGGFVYRGEDYPGLQGYYIYADFCSDRIFALRQNEAGEWVNIDLANPSGVGISSFGEDQNGEMYMAGLSNGKIYRLTDACGALNTEVIVADEENLTLSVTEGYAAYQWYLNDDPITDAIASTLLIDTSGSYSVAITNEAGCSVVVCCSEQIVSATPEAVGLETFVLSPNPAHEQLLIRGVAAQGQRYVVSIISANGQLLRTVTADWAGAFSLQLPVNDLAAGTYFLEVRSGDQRFARAFQKN